MSFRFIEHHWISLSAQKGLKGVTGKQNIVIELRVLLFRNYGFALKINELIPCRISLGLTVSSSTLSPSHGRSRQDNLQVLFIRNGALI